MKSGAASAIGLLIAAAVLYLARDVLVPFALAILLAFLLAPAARRLERWKLGRVLSTVIVVAFGFSLIGAVGYVAGTQAVALAAKLPEYRKNITAKIRDLKKPGEGKIAQAYRLLFSRPPTKPEISLGLDFLQHSGRAWPQYTQALLSSSEFSTVN